MTLNPSHILIARNSRGSNNPSASLSFPTETHAAAAGIFRSSGSPTGYYEEGESDDNLSDISAEYYDEQSIQIDECFTKQSHFPGTVKILVENTTFWAHREVLYFASPFFEATLSGNWAETGRRGSISSVVTFSQPPSTPGDKEMNDICLSHLHLNAEAVKRGTKATNDSGSEESDGDEKVGKGKEKARHEGLTKQSKEKVADVETKEASTMTEESKTECKTTQSLTPIQVKTRRRRRSAGTDAVIIFKEERASTFHDFLKFVYPHLECTITWNNVEGLMHLSHKLSIPSLQRECLTFLLTHAAGRPIKAMRIAELFDEEDLYRESSRFVLDNPGGWSEQELSTLSGDTLLKLEKRRNWFLERVLKLGLTSIAKEYQCCTTCPDPIACARQLEEKWKQAYHAVFRFGPCQPSMVYRYLRTLEGINPPLSLVHLSCQATAKAFVATLFDRMFSLGVRGSGTDAAPLGARVAAVASGTGPRRHFLYCSLKPEAPRKKRSRDPL